MSKPDLIEGIRQLKTERKAVLLAHYYQEPDIQELADYVGDSLGLSQQAAQTDAEMIVFAGVYFMAETAKILNPEKKVVIPDARASCSLAESCPSQAFRDFIEQHPDHMVISYVNCAAEIKAMSDIICTSSNAEKIIHSLPEKQPIIFAPDKNLGHYLIQKTGRRMVLWEGTCVVHEAFSFKKILDLHRQHPAAKFIAHPESEKHVLDIASYIGSTAGMINFVKNDPAEEFIIATENGILHEMQKAAPLKKLIAAPAEDDNTCACSECAFMKMNTLEKVYNCMKYGKPEVTVPDSIREKALVPLRRMLELSKSTLHA